MTHPLTSPLRVEEDISYESQLRPKTFNEFVGQHKLKENLSIFIQAAQKRGESIDHILLSGPPGLGKTTLAYCTAYEMKAEIVATSGPVIERPFDLAGILTNLKTGNILFIDEIHRLPKQVEEYLYSAMENWTIDFIVDKGPAARNIKLKLPPFTLIGATTRLGLLSNPLRSRFGIPLYLEYYPPEDLIHIVRRSAKILKVPVTSDGVMEIARRSRGTPRIVNRLLKRVRDFAQVKADGRIDIEIARFSLERLEVDELGLNEIDKKILQTIAFKFGKGPVGLKTLSSAIGEDEGTIEEVYEPFLLREGLIQKTSKGRVLTRRALKHLGVDSTSLF